MAGTRWVAARRKCASPDSSSSLPMLHVLPVALKLPSGQSKVRWPRLVGAEE